MTRLRLAALSVLLFLACGDDPLFAPLDGATIVGVVTRVIPVGENRPAPSILVEEKPRDSNHVGKIYFFVYDETQIVVRAGKVFRSGTFDELRVGSLVRAWAGDIILESFPAVTSGARIEVLRPAD